jgi:hypothetical protein
LAIGRLFGVPVTEDKMENGYESWLKYSYGTKSGEIRRFLEVPYRGWRVKTA